MLGSQGIVVKCTAAIFFLMEDCFSLAGAELESYILKLNTEKDEFLSIKSHSKSMLSWT